MKLENQVCSLDLAKKLKELGVKQESYWYWQRSDAFPTWMVCPYNDDDFDGSEAVSAFTIAELGGMLPQEINSRWFTSMKTPHGWSAGYGIEHEWDGSDTETTARAKMLIYLLENKLVKL